MSWQAYVDTSLIGSGDIDQAAIFSVDGSSAWAASPGLKVKPEEMKVITGAFGNADAAANLFGTGIVVDGQKYITLKSDDSSIYGKKGKTGIIVVKTKQALLIAHYPETVNPGTAANTVEKLGDYLKSVGY